MRRWTCCPAGACLRRWSLGDALAGWRQSRWGLPLCSPPLPDSIIPLLNVQVAGHGLALAEASLRPRWRGGCVAGAWRVCNGCVCALSPNGAMLYKAEQLPLYGAMLLLHRDLHMAASDVRLRLRRGVLCSPLAPLPSLALP